DARCLSRRHGPERHRPFGTTAVGNKPPRPQAFRREGPRQTSVRGRCSRAAREKAPGARCSIPAGIRSNLERWRGRSLDRGASKFWILDFGFWILHFVVWTWKRLRCHLAFALEEFDGGDRH